MAVVLWVHILKKSLKVCLLMQGAWFPCGRAVLNISWFRWIHVTQSELGKRDSPVLTIP